MTTETPELNSPKIYTNVFWLAYAANVALVTANALTFRFAELVAYLGGTEQAAGAIVSIGMIGALSARFFLGQAIDRYGTRKLWTASSVLFVTGCSAFLLTDSLSWTIFAARIAYATGLAGMFTCSIVHVQSRVPIVRRTEVIGNLGSSGFVGIILGSLLGDWILTAISPGSLQFQVLFGTSVALGAVYFVIVVILTRGDDHDRPHETPAAHHLLMRYWPGNVLLVAIMMGVGLAVTTVFLTRFATERNLGGIGLFFTVYSVSAFILRISTRRWSQTIGRHRMIVYGLGGHCIGHLLLPFVTAEWEFLLPAVFCGFGHALLFPAVVSIGSGSFPPMYRGTGTTITLGFTEVGVLLSAPVLGRIIDSFGFTPMFWTSSAFALLVMGTYAATSARLPDLDNTGEFEQLLETEPAVTADSKAVCGKSCGSVDEARPAVLLESGGGKD